MSSKTNPKMYLITVLAFLITSWGQAKADFTFGMPTKLGPNVNTAFHDAIASISADGLTLWMDSNRSGGSLHFDIWMSTRSTLSDSWGTPVRLESPVNSGSWDGVPSISADGLTLYFSSNRPGGQGDWDTWITTRETVGGQWGTPVNLGQPVNSSAFDWVPSITADGLSLFFCSNRSGGSGNWDIWVTTRATTDDDWSTPVNLGPTVNSSSHEFPTISPDGLTLFLTSNRPGGHGGRDIWVTRRATTNDPWAEPVNLGPPINGSGWDQEPIISPDGSTLYFNSERGGGDGGLDIWQASIEPVVDLNDDGIVDAADMCIMVDHWGENYPLCDIGPTPFGDGMVDVHDLVVLAGHLFTCPGAVAHWALDETEGDIAYDSVTTNDAVVIGGALWQPDGGQVGGALAFDGIDDYLSANFVLNPMDGAFSVFAWIKGGAPGQVILSQVDTPMDRGVKPGSTWLGTDPSEGKLMAGLTHAVLPLKSDFVITDDQWHEIGLIYDGSSKYLYVDGAEVAKDDLRPLLGNDGGLHIGVGKDLEPGSFFSGLIDNVRVYDRAVIP